MNADNSFCSIPPATRELTSYTRFIKTACSQSRVSSSVCLDLIVDANAEASKPK